MAHRVLGNSAPATSPAWRTLPLLCALGLPGLRFWPQSHGASGAPCRPCSSSSRGIPSNFQLSDQLSPPQVAAGNHSIHSVPDPVPYLKSPFPLRTIRHYLLCFSAFNLPPPRPHANYRRATDFVLFLLQPGPECPPHYLRHATTVRPGFSEAPPEVLGGQVPFSKLASRDAALFALPKGRRDALGIEHDHRTRLPGPGESSESGSNFPAWRAEERGGGRGGGGATGAGAGPRGGASEGRGLAARANGAARRGGEARRQRGDARARSGAEAELADPECIRRRAPRPRQPPRPGRRFPGGSHGKRSAASKYTLWGFRKLGAPSRPRPLRRRCRWRPRARPRPRRAGPVPVGCGRAEGPGGRRRAAAPRSLHRLPQPGPGPTLRRTGRRAGNAWGAGGSRPDLRSAQVFRRLRTCWPGAGGQICHTISYFQPS